MTFHQQTINNFIHLLITRPSLFSTQHRTELEQIIASLPDDIKQLPPDTIEQLSNDIVEWCESHSAIDKALSDLEDALKGDQLKASKTPGIKEGKVPLPDYKANKQNLLNAIRQSSPSSSQSSQTGS